MTITPRAALAALMLTVAAPSFAQMPPPGESGMPMNGPDKGKRMMRGGMMAGGGMGHGAMARGMFDALSPEGRKTMLDAMAAAGDTRKADHERVRAARDRMMTVLEADRLDTAALKRAMDDEQAASSAGRDRVQAAMLGGFAKLTVADRKAFVAYGRAMKNRMEARMEQWQKRRGMGGMDMPPPPPPLL